MADKKSPGNQASAEHGMESKDVPLEQAMANPRQQQGHLPLMARMAQQLVRPTVCVPQAGMLHSPLPCMHVTGDRRLLFSPRAWAPTWGVPAASLFVTPLAPRCACIPQASSFAVQQVLRQAIKDDPEAARALSELVGDEALLVR